MALTETEITSITNRHIVPKLADGIYGSNPAIARFTRPDKIYLLDGGSSIVCPVGNAKPSTSGGYYSGDETHNTSQTSDITAAVYDWKELYQAIRVSRIDFLKNSSDLGKLKLIAEKFKIGQAQMRDNLAEGLFSDGTAATGLLTTKQLTGIRAIASVSSTLGGIAVADMASWIVTRLHNSGTNRPLSLNLIQRGHNNSSFANDRVSVLYMNKSVLNELWALFQPFQRLVSSEMKKLGFDGILEVNGVPAIGQEAGIAANVLYGINEDMVQLAVHKDENMRVVSLENLETTSSMLKKIYWTGNLICRGRRQNFIIEDVQVAS